jgi:hypothetical protein
VARNASMEKSLTEMQTASTTVLESLTRNIENLATQLAEQRRLVDASLGALATLTTHLDEQMRVNATFRQTLEQIVHRMQMTPPPPQTSASPVDLAASSSSVSAIGNMTVSPPQLSHRPGPGATSASDATNTTSSTETHAFANPARNGSAQRHG